MYARAARTRPRARRRTRARQSDAHAEAFAALLALLPPWLAVLLTEGLGLDLFINLLLSYFGRLPARIHSLLLLILG
jgi:uncharacterized membrane protein YqaE (UPF0057 family)